MRSKAQQKIYFWIIRLLFIPAVFCFNLDANAGCYISPEKRTEQYKNSVSPFWCPQPTWYFIVNDTIGKGNYINSWNHWHRFVRFQGYLRERTWEWNAWDARFAYNPTDRRFEPSQGIGVGSSPADETSDQAVWLAAIGEDGKIYTVKETEGWLGGTTGEWWVEVPPGQVTHLPWSNFRTFPDPSQVIHNGELRVIRPNSVRWHPTLRIPPIPSGEKAAYFGAWTNPRWNNPGWNGSHASWVVESSKVPACTAKLLNAIPVQDPIYSPACSPAQPSLDLGSNKKYKEVQPVMLNTATQFGKGKTTTTQQGSWEIPLRSLQ